MGTNASDVPAATPFGVGLVLRAAREKSGNLIGDVSRAIRISESVLTAIEEGRFGDLPAPAYAVGFVRSYANYLDLDADEAVRRLKLETAGAPDARELIFPRPPGTGWSPSRNRMAIALLLALLVYGVWYVSSRLPHAGAPPDGYDDAAAGDILPPGPSGPPEQAGLRAEAVIPPEVQDQPPVIEGEVQLEAALPASPASPQLPDAAIAGDVLPLPELEAPPAPEASPPLPLAPAPVPAILLRARADTWIQVARPGGEVLTSRILRAGEEYIPPAGSGLTLATGNAGGLEIYVNGQALPPVGRRGAIVRGILLDPESLMATGAPAAR